MMHFVRTFSIMPLHGIRRISIKEFEIMKKIVYIKNIFENGWWEDAYPSFYPLDPSLAISNRHHQKNLAYFSHLAPLILFFFTKRQSQKGRAWHYAPLPLSTLLHRPYQLSLYSKFYRNISEFNEYETKTA